MKYIIKNCPAFNSYCNWCRDKQKHCKDITDCVLKHIIEKCNRNIDRVYYLDGKKIMQGQKLAVDILKQVEIEEVND